MLNHTDLRSSKEVALIAGFSLIAAILFTGSWIFTLQKNRIFATSALATKAEVVEILKEHRPNSSSSDLVLVPVFQYKVAGAIFERRAETRYLPAEIKYSVGDTMLIYYNPENPSEIRDVLRTETSTAPTIFIALAAISWFLFGTFSIHSFRIMHFETRGRRAKKGVATETKCVFIALEATNERVQNARMIRMVCRWTHPETGVEWLLRSANIHPTELPAELELGALVACKVDFDDPTYHHISWKHGEPPPARLPGHAVA